VSPAPLLTFLYGALATSSFVAGAFFLRFWKSSRDRLFVFFVLGFWTLCVNWVALALYPHTDEQRVAIYVIRLVAFVLIIVGVVDKNRRAR
jgi:hypothetical protein